MWDILWILLAAIVVVGLGSCSSSSSADMLTGKPNVPVPDDLELPPSN